MNGIGLTMSMDSPPHLEAMGARGLIGLRHSLAKALPFADGAFDLLHSRMSGLGFAGARAESRAERSAASPRSSSSPWDRVVRPGGYLVQHGWMLSSPVTANWDRRFVEDEVKARIARGETASLRRSRSDGVFWADESNGGAARRARAAAPLEDERLLAGEQEGHRASTSSSRSPTIGSGSRSQIAVAQQISGESERIGIFEKTKHFSLHDRSALPRPPLVSQFRELRLQPGDALLHRLGGGVGVAPPHLRPSSGLMPAERALRHVVARAAEARAVGAARAASTPSHPPPP